MFFVPKFGFIELEFDKFTADSRSDSLRSELFPGNKIIIAKFEKIGQIVTNLRFYRTDNKLQTIHSDICTDFK